MSTSEAWSPVAAAGEPVPVLFDTDIGSDIDDALALAYLLHQPRCQLLGITTVTGEPQRRAQLADAICRAAGRSDVPIFSGAAQPLLVNQRQPHAPQAEILARWPHRSEFPPNEAVAFLREVIRSRPGEVTLLAVGPLTNVALLFALDPEIPGLLRQLVLMCGVFTNRLAGVGPLEWNALVDPHATAIVYRAPVARHLSVGLDVTCRCRLPADVCRQRLRGGALDVVADAAEVWFRGRPEIVFHDPLAAALVFEPDLCRYEDGQVEVELTSPRLQGMTHFDRRGPQRPHRIAVEVEAERFFAHYFAVTGGGR